MDAPEQQDDQPQPPLGGQELEHIEQEAEHWTLSFLMKWGNKKARLKSEAGWQDGDMQMDGGYPLLTFGYA
jgi:hypothetical protein